jgi:polyphosphate glucokinase
MKRAKALENNVLAIDVGGSHVKFMTESLKERREFASGAKLSAGEMVAQVKSLTKDWTYSTVSIGYPGQVARNRPLAEPHNLGPGWAGFDFEKAFDRPTRVVNDALMQAVGSYEGGRMLFLGLGTGLGSAVIDDGILEPMELAHLPFRKGKTFEDYVGAEGLERQGKKKWRQRVHDVIERLVAALEPDYVVLGGGNADKVGDLPKNVRLGDNENAFKGGLKLWSKQFARSKR